MAYLQHNQRSSWGSFTNPQFTRLHNQIEEETQNLLRERDSLLSLGTGNNTATNNYNHARNHSQQQHDEQPFLKTVHSSKYIKMNSDRSQTSRQQQYGNIRNSLSDKVRQLIQMCKGENSAFGNQLIKVLRQEKQIHQELVSSSNKLVSSSNQQSSQKTHYFGVSNPIMEAQKESSVVHGSRDQQFTSRNQSAGKQNLNNNLAANQPKSNIRQALQNNPKLQVGDDLIQMIEQIQRKALSEIQKLREQKIDLMKQLKQQIQSNNELQRQVNTFANQQHTQQQHRSQQKIVSPNYTPFKNYTANQEQVANSKLSGLQEQILRQIRVQMDNLRQQNQSLRFNIQAGKSGVQQQFQIVNPQQSSQLRSRIALLEQQLHSRDQLINSLSGQVSRLNQNPGSNSSSNPQQMSQLLQQGEMIRQNTLHLIRLKEGNSSYQPQQGIQSSQRVRELEELLEREEEEKQSFLNDLLAFKQKYQQLEEQNRVLKRQSKMGSSDLARLSPIYEKSIGQNIGSSLDDYERFLSQMKGNRY